MQIFPSVPQGPIGPQPQSFQYGWSVHVKTRKRWYDGIDSPVAAVYNMANLPQLTCPGQALLFPAFPGSVSLCSSLTDCRSPLDAQTGAQLYSEDGQPVRPEEMAEYATCRVRSALKACKRFYKGLSDMMQSSQKVPLKVTPQCPETTCPICSNSYDVVHYMPLCLPCGHTLCSACVQTISRRGLICPFDRQHVDSTGLPVNLVIAEAALSELESAQCPEHGSQIIAYCPSESRSLCGLCIHDSDHEHWLFDSQEAEHMAVRKLTQLGERLEAVGVLAQHLADLTSKVEELLLRVTVKFNGFSLIHKPSKEDRKQAHCFTGLFMRIRSSLESSEMMLERYVQANRSLYWNAGRVPRWTLLTSRLPKIPERPKVLRALEAVQKWLEHNG